MDVFFLFVSSSIDETCDNLLQSYRTISGARTPSPGAEDMLHMAKHDRIDFSLRTDREAQERRVTFAKTHRSSRKLGRN